MEDFIQIIIIIIFILSAISSSKKKKDKGKTPPLVKPTQLPQNMNKNKNIDLQNAGTKILENIFGFKLELPEPQKTQVPVNYSDDIPSLDNKRVEYVDYDEEKGLEEINEGTEDNYTEKYLAHKSQINAAKEKRQSFKVQNKSIHDLKSVNRFAKLMKEKNSLKNYIIIQEILSKPKALRK